MDKPFKVKKPTKVGSGYYVRIPTKFVKEGLVNVTKPLEVTVKEVDANATDDNRPA